MNSPVWKIDQAHSSIHFSVRHLMVARVHGQFRRFGGELALNESDITRSSVRLHIDLEGVDTGNADRDASLRSERFFDAARFPVLSFNSREVERSGESMYRVVGDLTVRDVTRPVVLEIEHGGFITDLRGARRAGFSVRTSVQRSEFGMVWNQTLEAGGVAISDRVDIHADVETVSESPKIA
jgi:polyisoprenoid-binding protein YceI